MNDFIDGVLEPLLWLLADWSLRWGAVILLFAGWLVFFRPRRAAARYVVGLVALAAGLLIPVLPRWGGGFSSLAIPRPEPVTVAERIAPDEPAPSEELRVEVLPMPDGELARGSAVEQPAEVLRSTVPASIPPKGEPLGAKRLVFLSLGVVWLTGMLVLILRRLGGWLLLQRMRRTALAVQGAPAEVFLDCRTELGLRRPVRLATHPRVRSPITLGLFHPTILVPPNWPDLPKSTQRGSLLHELAHLGRYDDALALLFELVRVVFFFHPLVRWLLAMLERERELLCDETAVACGLDPREYARMLMEFARQPGRLLPAPFIGHLYPIHFGNRRTVKIRINRLLEANMYRWMKPLPPWRTAMLVAVCLFVALAASSFRMNAAQSTAEKASVSGNDLQEVNDPKGRPVPEELAIPGPLQEPEILGMLRPLQDDEAQDDRPPYRIRPFQMLQIAGIGLDPRYPLDGKYVVEPDGKLNLGPYYRRVEVGGLTLEQAERKIESHLKTIGLGKPQISLSVPPLSYGGKALHEWFNVLATDLKPDVRVEAIKAISAFGVNGYGKEAASAIIDAMRAYDVAAAIYSREDQPFVQAAFAAMSKIGQAAVPALITELKTGRTNGRRFASDVLSRFGPTAKAAAPVLLAAAKDTDDSYVRKTVLGTVWIDPKAEGFVPALIAALKDEDPEVRNTAAAALIRRGPAAKTAVPALIAAFKDKDKEVRVLDIAGLMNSGLGSKLLVAALIAELRDPNEQMRRYAISSLGTMAADAKEAVPALVELLRSSAAKQEDPSVAVVTLGQIGPAAKEAVPILTELLKKYPPVPPGAPVQRGWINPKYITEALEKITK